MAKHHDASYKKMFFSPVVVRHLIDGFVPHAYLEQIDFDTLENLKTCLTGDNGEDRRADALWRVKVNDEWRYLLILIEFQSRIDRVMALRMMAYVVLIYQDLLRTGTVKGGILFPPVLPIVLYNGGPPWTALTDIADLIGTMPEPLHEFVPRMKHFVVDLGRYDTAQLKAQRNLVACMARLERPGSPEELKEVVGDMAALLPDDSELHRMALDWVEAVIFNRSGGKMTIPAVQNLREFKMGLEQSFKDWGQVIADENLEKGISQGISQGEALALQKVLTARFGPLPDATKARIDDAPISQIDIWLIRVLRAETLSEVFSEQSRHSGQER